MSSSAEQPAEHQSGEALAKRRHTYVIDPENPGELARLTMQERIITEGMGGLFPEGLTLPPAARVLDLACGPGGWVLDLARTYPDAEVIGVDISPTVVEYATVQAQTRRLANASFQVMDVTEPLAFPETAFDLVNGRLLSGFMLPSAWPHLVAEGYRLLKPGAVLRLTEGELSLTTSPTLSALHELGTRVLKMAGRSFSPDGRHVGITPVLPRLLRQAGFQQVRLHATAIEWSIDTPAYYGLFKDCLMGLELIQPFLLGTGLIEREELQRQMQQALAEMQQDDFCALWTLVTVWGQKPTASSPA
ncbi:MAG: methyltransferase domain-containing protein [Thermogemmatispora sp.]|jgi:ubiquinone/menaquinone biosynthesis C-methylase UbiE|uniref:class I SAM-dependent methyltransferase n=1 Tax=Thermogemmatispora sp. TaxID=1968838 RepID=UPI0019DA56E1|nr:class I SAM-dependent methyltransferase [Thermogemmatispora sp.]MBE3566542.1 methyltransferase domain-containing protein [Thermogemmatispora sp.]